MDISDCWRHGKQLAGWMGPTTRFEPIVHVQGNRAALESLAEIFRRLAHASVGERVMIDTMTGLNAGDLAFSIEHTNTLAPPPPADLLETRVALPDEGDAVLWAQVPETRREDVVRLLVAEAGQTSLQAREAISRGGVCSVRLPIDVAVRLRDALRRLTVDASLFELRS